MRHTDEDFAHVRRGGALQQFLDHGDHGLAAFERKSLVALEAVVEERLEARRQHDRLKRALLGCRVDAPLIRRGLHALLEPLRAPRRLSMCMYCTPILPA